MGMTVPAARSEELSVGWHTAVWERGGDLPGCACSQGLGEGRGREGKAGPDRGDLCSQRARRK